MKDYKISLVDMSDSKIDLKVRKLVNLAYQSDNLMEPFRIHKNISLEENKNKSIFLVAHINNDFVGCNGFIGNKFFYNGNSFHCYQSCWSATHPSHQKKGIFVNIQQEAERILRKMGAGMIFGLPNNNSRPIFINKLGFVERSCDYLQIPNLPIPSSMIFQQSYHDEYSSIRCDEKEVFLLKKRSGKDLHEFSVNSSYLWGKIVKKKKFGLNFNYFAIGGYRISNLDDLKEILSKIRKMNILYVELVSCKSNQGNSFFKNWRNSKGNNPFIFKFLNLNEIKDINIFLGTIDVF